MEILIAKYSQLLNDDELLLINHLSVHREVKLHLYQLLVLFHTKPNKSALGLDIHVIIHPSIIWTKAEGACSEPHCMTLTCPNPGALNTAPNWSVISTVKKKPFMAPQQVKNDLQDAGVGVCLSTTKTWLHLRSGLVPVYILFTSLLSLL